MDLCTLVIAGFYNLPLHRFVMNYPAASGGVVHYEDIKAFLKIREDYIY